MLDTRVSRGHQDPPCPNHPASTSSCSHRPVLILTGGYTKRCFLCVCVDEGFRHLEGPRSLDFGAGRGFRGHLPLHFVVKENGAQRRGRQESCVLEHDAALNPHGSLPGVSELSTFASSLHLRN